MRNTANVCTASTVTVTSLVSSLSVAECSCGSARPQTRSSSHGLPSHNNIHPRPHGPKPRCTAGQSHLPSHCVCPIHCPRQRLLSGVVPALLVSRGAIHGIAVCQTALITRSTACGAVMIPLSIYNIALHGSPMYNLTTDQRFLCRVTSAVSTLQQLQRATASCLLLCPC